MERRTQDVDSSYNIRQNENTPRYERRNDSYATYDSIGTDQYLSNRSNYERSHRNGQSAYSREPVNHDQITNPRNFRQNSDDRERTSVTNRPSARFESNNNPEINRQSQLSDHQQSSSRINYTIPPNSSRNPRSIVLDINITINTARNSNPQVRATPQTIPRQLSPVRSTAILEDIGFVDLDIRSPERTAHLVTDGSIRSSSSFKQSTTIPHSNTK